MRTVALDDFDEIKRLLDSDEEFEVLAVPDREQASAVASIGVRAPRIGAITFWTPLIALAGAIITRLFSSRQLDRLQEIMDLATVRGYDLEIDEKPDGSRKVRLTKSKP